MRDVKETPEARAEIGERIQRARVAAGYTVAAEFARACGVQPNTLYRWERGDIAPDIFRLESIGRAARVSTDWLLRGAPPVAASRVLAAWKASARGASARPAAIAFLEALPLEGYEPSFMFYDLALLAFEQGLSPEAAALAAKFTEGVKKG